MAGYAKYILLQRIKAWASVRITNFYNEKYEKTETTPITKVNHFFQLSVTRQRPLRSLLPQSNVKDETEAVKIIKKGEGDRIKA